MKHCFIALTCLVSALIQFASRLNDPAQSQRYYNNNIVASVTVQILKILSPVINMRVLMDG